MFKCPQNTGEPKLASNKLLQTMDCHFKHTNIWNTYMQITDQVFEVQ